MSGSIKRDPQRGTWTFIVDVPAPDGGRRQLRRRGFKTKREAAEAQAAVIAAAARGTLVVPTRTSLGTFVLKHWLPMIGQRVRPTTFDGYRRAVTNHVLPDLGAIVLTQLSRASGGVVGQ
jgi:Arm DNA-binding domain/Phage integrase, N-terminal SAM-like domain